MAPEPIRVQPRRYSLPAPIVDQHAKTSRHQFLGHLAADAQQRGQRPSFRHERPPPLRHRQFQIAPAGGDHGQGQVRFGDPHRVILASMYRQLAHAPDFLRQVEAALAPVEADGSLARAIAANRRDAHERAKVLARAIDAQRAPFAGEVEASVSAFVDHAIGKMVTICRAIRQARTSAG